LITSSWGQRLRFSARTRRAHRRGVNALIPSPSQTQARRHDERYVAPHFHRRRPPRSVRRGPGALERERGTGRIHRARPGRQLPHRACREVRGV